MTVESNRRWITGGYAAVLAFLVVVAAPIAHTERAGGVAIEPSPGRKLVWEFDIDVAQLNAGRGEAAPIQSKGNGAGRIHYNTGTHLMRYEISWSGLEGEVTSIELRGPAHGHQNTKRRLTEFPTHDSIPRAREGDFRGEHVVQLQRQEGFQDLPPSSVLIVLISAGGYVSIQTTAHPEGEIRGNLLTAQLE